MSTGGWITMVLSVGGVTTLFLWCIYKVVTTRPESGDVHGFEFETPDTREERERR